MTTPGCFSSAAMTCMPRFKPMIPTVTRWLGSAPARAKRGPVAKAPAQPAEVPKKCRRETGRVIVFPLVRQSVTCQAGFSVYSMMRGFRYSPPAFAGLRYPATHGGKPMISSRRWFQFPLRFSLRTAAAVVTVLCAIIAARVRLLQQRQVAISVILTKDGTAFAYDGHLISRRDLEVTLSSFFWTTKAHLIDELVFRGPGIEDSDLVMLSSLRELRTIQLEAASVSDDGLRFLEGCDRLEYLDLNMTKISDA